MNKILALLILALTCIIPDAYGQNLTIERDLHRQILKDLKSDISEKYYDPKLRGIDLDASVKNATTLIAAATSVEEMTDIVARVLIQFDDSHLAFIPPEKTVSVDYGWRMQLYGDKVFITDVADDSDAKKKGIRPGDQIYMLDGFLPTRKDFSLLKYHYEILSPQPKLTLIIVKPSGNKYKVEIVAKVTRENIFRPETRELRMRFEKDFEARSHQSFYDGVPGVSIWKIPSFEFSDIKVDKMMGRVRKAAGVVVDLRGNAGGLVYSLGELVRAFFEKDVTIGEIHFRKKTEVGRFRGDGKDAYSGKLVVLIDSESSSAAEMFARIVQLEKRGLVVGQQSSGMVMMASEEFHSFGLSDQIGYGFSITIADIVMKDGQRLEKIGVTPDEEIIPTAADLAAGRDPVLARAVELSGAKMSAVEAGKIFSKENKR